MKLEKVKEINTEERIWSLDWHPKCQVLAAVGEARTIQLWRHNEQNGWYLHETLHTSHTKSLRCVKFSHDGKTLAVASFDATISIFKLEGEGYQEKSLLEGHENQVKCISWSPNDTKLASCSRDRNVWIWSYNNISHDYECQAILQGHTDDVKCVIWLEHDLIASSSYDTNVRLWAQQDGEFGPFQELQTHTSTVWSLAYDQKSGILYSCGQDCQIVAWKKDNTTGRFEKFSVISNVHVYPIYSLTLLNPELLVTGSGDNSLALISKGQVVFRGLHQGDVNCVARSNNLLASGGDDQKIIIWKLIGI